MSGVNNGVQQIISENLGRDIVYVHCYNHQLHLVVLIVFSSDPQVSQTFTIAEQFYVFFKRFAVGTKYSGIFIIYLFIYINSILLLLL